MKFGVREICNVVFRAKDQMTLGGSTFAKNQPVLYIDSAKASTLEGAATSVYATGGRGNTRLLTWEGEKTLSFSVEDALISQMGLAILSGAGLIKGKNTESVHVHKAIAAQVADDGTIDVKAGLGANEKICSTAAIFVMACEADGTLTGETASGVSVAASGQGFEIGTSEKSKWVGKKVVTDFYITKTADKVSEIQIDAAHFAGYFYVEAETLFRRQTDGVDAPVVITLPNVKIQSNFTFSMASSGDPSTFNFQMDAHPGYTYFNPTKEVLCVMQIVEDSEGKADEWSTVMAHTSGESVG